MMKAVREEGKGRIITPHALQIDRAGDVIVKMKASVIDSERLTFTVLRKNMQCALDSLEVTDSRGTTPLVTFSSPTNFDGKKMQSEQAWDAMLREARGARVQVEAEGGCADGTLMGIQRDFAANDEQVCSTSVVLLSNGEVSVHRVDDIRSVCFLDDDITERLKRESFLKHSVVETLKHYRIVIVVSGKGEGQVNVCYRQQSPYTPAFETFYTMNDTADENGYRKTKRFFTIRNPMHYDIVEVEVQLQTGIYRRGRYGPAYGDVENPDSSSDSVSERSTEEDDEFFDLASSDSTTSIRAEDGLENNVYNINQKVTLKEGESVRIFHSETAVKCDFLFSTEIGKTNVVDTQSIQNVGGELLGAGTWFWEDRATKEKRSFYYYDVAGHTEYGSALIWSSTPRCRGSKQRIPEIGRALCSEVTGNKLRVSFEWNVTAIYRFQNESSHEFDMFLQHECVVSPRRRSHIEASMQYADKGMHAEEAGAKLELSCCSFRTGVRNFMLKLAPRKETIVTVREKSTPECPLQREYAIPGDCTVKKLQFLRSRGAVNESTMKRLEEVMRLVRDFSRLERDHKAHLEKLQMVRAKLEEEGKVEQENGEDLLGKYLESMDRARTMSEGITEAVDRVELSMAETRLKIRKVISTLNAIGKTM